MATNVDALALIGSAIVDWVEVRYLRVDTGIVFAGCRLQSLGRDHEQRCVARRTTF